MTIWKSCPWNSSCLDIHQIKQHHSEVVLFNYPKLGVNLKSYLISEPSDNHDKFVYIYFICMDTLLGYFSEHHIWSWFPWRTENVRYRRTRATGNWEPPSRWQHSNVGIPEEQPSLLWPLNHLSAPHGKFLIYQSIHFSVIFVKISFLLKLYFVFRQS